MNKFKHFVIRPLIIIVAWALIFSFIKASVDFTTWETWLRFIYVILIFLTLMATDKEAMNKK